MVKEFTHLNFEEYITVKHGYMLCPEPHENYRIMTDLHRRARNVINFAWNIEKKSEAEFSEGYFRAALCEFFAIEDYLETSYPERYKGVWFNEHRDSDPILHMLHLLRNYNIHISSSEMSTKQMLVTTEFLQPAKKHFNITVNYVSNLTIDGFSKVRAARCYTQSLERMITVFEEQQHTFGLGVLLIECVLQNLLKLDSLLDAPDFRPL